MIKNRGVTKYVLCYINIITRNSITGAKELVHRKPSRPAIGTVRSSFPHIHNIKRKRNAFVASNVMKQLCVLAQNYIDKEPKCCLLSFKLLGMDQLLKSSWEEEDASLAKNQVLRERKRRLDERAQQSLTLVNHLDTEYKANTHIDLL